MTSVSEKEFLNKLLDVIAKLLSIAKAQGSRIEKLWNELLIQYNDKPHKIRFTAINKENFLSDIEYRISILKVMELSQVDGFYIIKSILETLYHQYFNSSEFKNVFTPEDQLMLKYMAAREILGNLIQYNQMEHETVPIKYNIIARNYLLIKLNGQTESEINENMKKLHVNITNLGEIMDEIVDDGLINKIKDGNEFRYTLNKELRLSEEGEKQFNKIGLRQIIDWPTQFWRSFYNIRELNVTVDDNVKYIDFLHQILAKCATQGFGAANYVLKNLIKYYEKIKEET